MAASTASTEPQGFRRRRETVPAGLVLYVADVPAAERTWFGPVPVTEPGRTLLDCAAVHVSPDLLLQAIQQARTRGLVPADRLAKLTTSAGRAPMTTSPRRYATPLAFKAALEQRMRDVALPPVGITRRRQLLVFDRYMARLEGVLGPDATLKGGLVLELRLERTRTTQE